MPENTEALPLAVGQIAAELGVPVAKIRYVVLQARIAPIGRAGHSLLYGRSQIADIEAALARTRRHNPESWKTSPVKK